MVVYFNIIYDYGGFYIQQGGDEMDKIKQGQIIKNVYRNFKWNFKAVIFFEIMYKLLALFIFIPINYYILNKAIANTGVHTISNKELISFGLSSKGIIGIFLILVVSFIAIFIEMAILTYIANKSNKESNVNLLEATINSVRIVPKKINVYMFFLVILSGVIGPITGIGLYNSLIRELTVPSFIKIELSKSMSGKILFILFMCSMFLILLKWVLSIPAVLIEKVSLKEAFRNSKHIYKNSRFKIFYYLVCWILVNLILRGVLLGLYYIGGYIAITILGISGILTSIFIFIYIALFLVGYVILSVINLPLFISFLVELYYEYRCYDVEEREFKSIKEYESNRAYIFINKYKKYVNAIGISVFCIMVMSMAAAAIKDRVIDKDIAITAHRGSSIKAPENSKSSIEQAILDGADYAEIDVMTTKDDEVVLFHDATLKRIDGTNRAIKEMTLEEVLKVDNGSYFSSEFSEEKIPTLDEVMQLSKGNIKLNIELKTVNKEDTLPEKVAEIIKKYHMENQVVISSMDYDAIQKVKEHSPRLEVGYIMSFGFGDFTKLNVDFVSVEYQMLSKELVYAMGALHKEVHVWTINDKNQAINAIRLKVDNIITDSTETIEAALRESKNYDEDHLTWFHNAVLSIIRYVKV